MMKPACSIFVALVLVALSAPTSSACSVPVFRYALNYWPADLYDLHAPSPKLPDDVTGNINPTRSQSGSSELMLGDRKIWSGELTPQVLSQILDSPIRKQIAADILKGDSVVWVLVESGDKAADDAAFKLLSDRLKYLESIAVVPELRADDPLSHLGPGPALAVRHSILRLSRKDPKEAITLAMLESEPVDASKPVVYPVFGRGRVLIAVPQDKLTTDNIDEVSQFLTSDCSCEVKDRRMGWDLMISCDWDEGLAKAEQQRLDALQPTVAGATTQPAPEPLPQTETVTIEAHRAPADAGFQPAFRLDRSRVMIGVAAVLLAVFGGVLWFRKRA